MLTLPLLFMEGHGFLVGNDFLYSLLLMLLPAMFPSFCFTAVFVEYVLSKEALYLLLP